MSGVPNIKIAESVEELKSEMKKQKTALNFGKVQAIYLLKIQAVETVRYLAVIIGRSDRLRARLRAIASNFAEKRCMTKMHPIE